MYTELYNYILYITGSTKVDPVIPNYVLQGTFNTTYGENI